MHAQGLPWVYFLSLHPTRIHIQDRSPFRCSSSLPIWADVVPPDGLASRAEVQRRHAGRKKVFRLWKEDGKWCLR